MKFKVVIREEEDGYYVVIVTSFIDAYLSRERPEKRHWKITKEAIEIYLEVLQEKELKKCRKPRL